MFALACLYLASVNLAAFTAFAVDKRASLTPGRWRVRERTLLTLAAVGGAFGAVLGQRLLRHKTRKEPFKTRLALIIAAELVVVAALLYVRVSGSAMIGA